MHGVGWRGWALAFSAATLAHAGVLMLVLRQAPEPETRPDAPRVAVFLGQVDSTGGGLSTTLAESPDAEMVAAVEGAIEAPPREATPAPPEPAAPAAPENAVALAALDADREPPPEESVSTPPEPAASAAPENAVALAALDADREPPPEESVSTPPEPAAPATPEDAVALAALDADEGHPPEESISTPPEPAASASPEDAVTLAALDADEGHPPEESISTPPEPAAPAAPEDALALAALDADGEPPLEESISTPPEPAASASPEDAVTLAALDADGEPPPEESISTPPEPAASASPEDAVTLAAIEAARLPPVEVAASAPPEPAMPPSLVPVSANTPARDSVAEPVRLVEAESVVSARAPPELLPLELINSAGIATLNVDPQEYAAVVLNMDEAAEASPLWEAAQAPPPPAMLPPPEEAVALAAIEAGQRLPPKEAAPTPPEPAIPPPPEDADMLPAADVAGHPQPEEAVSIVSEPMTPSVLEDAEVLTAIETAGRTQIEEAVPTPPEPATTPPSLPVPAGAPENAPAAAPVRLVAADSIVPAPTSGVAEPVEIVSNAEPATPSADSQELAVEVSGIDEASTDSRLQEAVSAPPAPATSPPLEEAGVLTAIETAGRTQIEEAVPMPPEPTTTPSFELVPAAEPANNAVAAPVRLVAADRIVPALAFGTAESVKIVDSAEPATPSRDSQELAVEVSGIDEASTDSRLQEAVSAPPAPATSPPLEEAGVLTAIETAGRTQIEEAVPTPPEPATTPSSELVPAQIVGPTEEVTMRTTTDAMAFTSASRGPESQGTQRTPGADEEAGASPGSADDGGVSAERAGYFARLQDWLSDRLKYPHVARARRQTGTASIYFEVDHTGKVQAYELRTSSGHELLDREALAMIKRAQPLPALPEQMRQERLELIVNIEFVLE